MKNWIRICIGIEAAALAVLAGWKMTEKRREHDHIEAAIVAEAAEEKKKVAITFDDGPNECYTGELLDGLAMREVKATFFLIGKKVEENPELVKRMYEEGHQIGNHSYDHVNLSELSEEAACEQVNKTNAVIQKVTILWIIDK